MHIGLCSPSWPPAGAANGIVTYVASIRDHFVAEGHDVSVIAGGRLHGPDGTSIALQTKSEDRSPLGILRSRVTRRIDAWNGALPNVARTIAAQVRMAHSIKPLDVVEMEESFGWSGHVSRAAGVPVVTRLHGPHMLKAQEPKSAREERSDRSRCRAEGKAISVSPSLTAPTRAMMERISTVYGRCPAALSAVIPNPVKLASEDDYWRLEACEQDHILMVGRFDFAKGADVMLSAFDRLVERRPTARLTLVGPDNGIRTASGRLQFDDYAARMLSPAAQARIDFKGVMDPQGIAALRKRAHVAVIASRNENFPYALLEALAVGSPAISTGWRGSEEIILDGETGMLVPVGEAEPLAASLEKLLSDAGLASRIAESGRRRCAALFSVDTVGGQLIDHYGATIERHQR